MVQQSRSGADRSRTVRPSIPHQVLFAAIFLVAFATLLLEVSLIRVLSFTIWHHFAYVVISTALLGFGASGTLLALRPAIGTHAPRTTLARCAAAAGLSAAATLAFVILVPLHPTALVSDPTQLAVLIAYQLMVTVPFFFSGLAVSLALRDAATAVDRLYFWDLLGAGLACLTAVATMNAFTPPGAVMIAAGVFLIATALLAELHSTRAVALTTCVIMAASVPLVSDAPFTIARSKELSLLRVAGGADQVRHEWTGLFRTDLVRPPVPAAPRPCQDWGLSSRGPAECDPARLYIAHDGTAGTGIYEIGQDARLPQLDFHILRMPYLVATPNAHVLVIGVGGGRDIVVARQFGAAHVTGVELDPVAVHWITHELDEVVGDFFRRPEVRLVVGEGRHAVEATDERFDLIQLTGVDTLAAEFSGAYVLAENYLYTVEAMQAYLDHLNPGGILSFATANGDRDAPRAAARMVSTARRALIERGVTHPEQHIAMIDSDQVYVEVMIGRDPFTPAQIATLKTETERLGFLPLHLPGSSAYPLYQALASTGGAERAALLERLRFRVDAVTDDRPFFFSFFRWNDLFSAGSGSLSPSHVTALGQIVLLVLLVTLTTLAGLLILGPLAVFQGRGLAVANKPAAGILLYFLALGAGFMLFEISLIQQFVLFLGYPTYSLTTTLGSLLVSLGCGSWLSRRFVGREHIALPVAVGALAVLTAWYVLGLPRLQQHFLGADLVVRVVITAANLAPLGLVMGIFFPLGIRRAASLHPDLVPWAWGINGSASVTAAVLAVVLAMTYGVTAVWLLSLGIYAAGTGAFLTLTRRPG